LSASWKVAKGSRKIVDSTGALVAMVMPAESPEATARRAQLIAAAPELQAQLDALRERSHRLFAALCAGQVQELRQARTARHLLAWQQARGMRRQAFAVDVMKGAWRLKAEECEHLRAENERLTSERDAARAEVERLKRQLADEQDIAERCQAYCGECKGLCSPDDDAALSETGGER